MAVFDWASHGLSGADVLAYLVKHYPELHDEIISALVDKRSAAKILEGNGASAAALEELERRAL